MLARSLFALLGGTVLSITSLTAPALAGGPTVVVEETPLTDAMAPAVTVADWQGLHFGIAAGRPTGDNFWAAPGVGAESTPGDWSGTMTSLSAGYDWQRGRLIYGLTLAVSGNGIDASPTYSETFLCEGCETTVDKLITLRGRIGLSSGKTLFFASAGAARADAIGTFSNFTAGKDSLTGWTAGIGVERFISQKTTLSGLCCTNRVRDSSRESSVVAGLHEQIHTPRLQDPELARL